MSSTDRSNTVLSHDDLKQIVADTEAARKGEIPPVHPDWEPCAVSKDFVKACWAAAGFPVKETP